ncbi:MAG: VOC family protein [Acidobacteria bacterium]|nr:VOC family protein [Acidobacteriota bacterium]
MKEAEAKVVNTLKAHFAINVRNVERSVEFYKKMLGMEPSKARPKYAKFDVQDPPLNLTLNERPFTDSGALFHMGIQVATTEDVLVMRERWVAAGLQTREEMQIVCGYALQDKSWVTDPDGNEWEVFVVHKDNLPSYYATDETAVACQSGVSCAEQAAKCESR